MHRIGQYEVTAELAAGSAGGVFQARDTGSGRNIALKLFRPAPGADAEVRARWIREALACSGLQHPNIAPILEGGEADGWLYITREWLNGVDLEQFIRQSRVAPLVEKIEMMAQVLDALEYAHRSGVLHRDVKPSNIFLCQAGPLRVLDFGLSRLPSARLALASRIPGTPNYYAPELIQRRPCDSRSDIFSAAVVFVELLINAHPFQHPFIPKRILESLPESPRIRNTQVPMELERLLMRALEKDPERRIQTGDELGSELREIARYLRTGQSGSPVSSLVVAAAPNQKAFAREPRVPAGAAINQATIDDPGDRRVGDLIVLMNEFEDALTRWDIEAARRLIDRMSAIQALDGRFALAIADCQQRLDEIGDSPRPVTQTRAAAVSTSPTRPTEPAGTQPASQAAGAGRQSGSRFVTASAAAPRVASAAPPQRAAVQPGARDPLGSAAPIWPGAPIPVPANPIPETPPARGRGNGAVQPPEEEVPPARMQIPFAPPRVPEPPQSAPGKQARPASAPQQAPAAGQEANSRPPFPPATKERPETQSRPGPPLPWLTTPAQLEPIPQKPFAAQLGPDAIPVDSATSDPALKAQSPATPESENPPAGPPPPKRSYAWLAAASIAGFIFIVVLFAAVKSLFAPAEIFSARPYVATAVVAADSTGLYESEDASSRRITSLRRGESFRILALPRGRGQEWIAAQVAGKQASSEPGYVRAADLEQWSSVQPDNLLALLSSYSPGDRAPVSELMAYADRVRGLLIRYPQFPDAPRATLELARTELAIARAMRLSGVPAEEWQPHLARAKDAVGSGIDPEARAMRRQLDEMAGFLHTGRISPETAEGAPPAERPAAPRAPNPAELLSRASAAWSNGDYRSAMRSIDRILAENPKNAEAMRWKVKVQRSQEAEAKLSR